MTPRTTNPSAFLQSPAAVALLVQPAELFGFLSRSFRLPADWMALVVREHGERAIFPAGAQLNDQGATEILLARSAPMTITFEDVAVVSVDHHACKADVRLSVSLVPDVGDLASFRRVVMGSARTAETSAIREYLLLHVTKAAALAAEGRGVEILIEARSGDDIAAELAEQLKGPMFSAGVRLDAPVVARFDSPVYRQTQRARAEVQRRREEFAAQRRIALAVETAQRQRAEHLADLLTKLRRQADDHPDVELIDLLRAFPDIDRGELYGALFATCDDQLNTEAIVVGSGSELLVFDPHELDAPTKRIDLPSAAGAVRSVQTATDSRGGRIILVGAATGVHELETLNGQGVRTYRAGRDREVRGGFNAVALVGHRILASHSELGLLAWTSGADEPGEPWGADRTDGAGAVRGLQFFDGDVYFSVDHTIYRQPADQPDAPPQTYQGSRSIITAVCADHEGVYAGNAEGEVLFWPHDAPDAPTLMSSARQRSAESVVILDLGVVRRLFYTDTSLAVFARVLGDTITSRYEAGGQTLRRVEVAPDIVVATNELRDRLICWTPGQPAQPYGVAPVAQITGHSVQDVCLLPAV